MNEKFMIPCDMCGSTFQFGPHLYDGKHIARYQITVCRACWESNWDGWAPHFGKRLEELLQKKNIPIPEPNSKGWYPRE